MRFFVFVILQICHAQKPCTLNPMRINLSVTKKFHCKSIRPQVHMKCSIWDRAREDGEFPLLIKDQRDYYGHFKVYFRMSVAQFDALLAILEPHIKRKTTHFCELRVQGFLQRFVICVMRDEVDELDNRHSGFWRSLLRWLCTVKTPFKMLATDAKKAKN